MIYLASVLFGSLVGSLLYRVSCRTKKDENPYAFLSEEFDREGI